MNQHEWVLGCQRYYAENYYEPGNFEDGVWEKCHYPVPKCLGGTETVYLLKDHHQVQGLLQSQEFNHRCFGFEGVKTFLENSVFTTGWFDLWDIYEYYAKQQGSAMNTQKARESKSKIGKRDKEERLARLFNHPRYLERCHLGGRATGSQRWMCKITGHVSNAGALTLWQRKRGIDVTQRERLS
jgi:hypothetical protein